SACPMMPAAHAIMMTASQNGKNPLRGPSLPHPTPRRRESKMTTAPTAARNSAVTMSARLMGPSLLEESAPGHELAVELLVLLDPLHVLGAGGERRLQRALLDVRLVLRGLGHLLQ